MYDSSGRTANSIREERPSSRRGHVVKEVELSEYVVRVLAHEFGDFVEDGRSHRFTVEPLKAGAVAILTYAWAHAWNPTKSDYDLDNSLNFQVYNSRQTLRAEACGRCECGLGNVHGEAGEPGGVPTTIWAGMVQCPKPGDRLDESARLSLSVRHIRGTTGVNCCDTTTGMLSSANMRAPASGHNNNKRPNWGKPTCGTSL